MMLDDARAARAFPRGDLALGFCGSCGFVTNVRFDGSLQHYAAGYEEQQSFSPRFRAFQSELIDRLVGTYDLREKDVVEIGCGKGDFLVELCARGGNRGVGIDPACDPARLEKLAEGRVRFIAELYGAEHADLPCDFLCCRHTLEHIHPTGEFIAHLRRVVGNNRDCLVFFEVPDVERVLRECAFWDIYYEHCSYFSLGSLARVFRANAFEVVELEKDFDDQYLLIVARPAEGPTRARLPQEDDVATIAAEVERFATGVQTRIADLRRQVEDVAAGGGRVAIWGSGSKCVSFLSTVGVADDVSAVIDINPYRQGKFLAGSVKQVVAPEHLRELPVDLILVMNPIYTDEIRAQVDALGVRAELVPV
jgi:SAM-dependent methyltransferase